MCGVERWRFSLICRKPIWRYYHMRSSRQSGKNCMNWLIFRKTGGAAAPAARTPMLCSDIVYCNNCEDYILTCSTARHVSINVPARIYNKIRLFYQICVSSPLLSPPRLFFLSLPSFLVYRFCPGPLIFLAAALNKITNLLYGQLYGRHR